MTFRDKITALESLSPDWDSYGALPINREVLDVVGAFLAHASDDSLDLTPLSDGGVQIEMHADGWEIEIEFMPRKEGTMQDIDGVWASAAIGTA